MNKLKPYIALLAVCTTMFLFSCAAWRKEVKKPVEASSASVLMGKVMQKDFQYQWITAKLDVEATVNGNPIPKIGGQLRMQKDNVIWISATSFLGIEAARIKITPDSVWVLNRLDNTYVAERFADVMKHVGCNLSFSDIQSVLAGNVMSAWNATAAADCALTDNGAYFQISRNPQVTSGEMATVDASLLKLLSVGINSDFGNISVSYDGYQHVGEGLLPASMVIESSGADKLSGSIVYSGITVNVSKDVPFKVNAKMERVKMR